LKDYIIKKALPDGKVSITLFADIETANEIARLAKQQSITVIDAGTQVTITSEPPTVKKTLAEIYQEINSLADTAQINLDKSKEESDTDSIVKSLINKFKDK
jgi:ArsR family metal-binding transcriptional regulator